MKSLKNLNFNKDFLYYFFIRVFAFFSGYFGVVLLKNIISNDAGLTFSKIILLSQGIFSLFFFGGNVESVYSSSIKKYTIFFLITSAFFLYLHLNLEVLGENFNTLIILNALIYAQVLFFEPVFRNTNFYFISHAISGKISLIFSIILVVIFNIFSEELNIRFSFIFLALNICIVILLFYLSNFRENNRRVLVPTNKDNFKSWLTSSINYFATNIDLLIVYIYFPTNASLSYFLITRLFSMINVPFIASTPYFSVQYRNKNILNNLQQVFHRQLKFNFYIISASVVIFIPVAAFFLSYLESTITPLYMILFALGTCMQNLYSGVGYYFLNQNMRTTLAILNITCFLIYVICLVIFALIGTLISFESLIICFFISAIGRVIITSIILMKNSLLNL